jgi:hypothetical protein
MTLKLFLHYIIRGHIVAINETDRQTNMDGPVSCSALTLERGEEQLKIRGNFLYCLKRVQAIGKEQF